MAEITDQRIMAIMAMLNKTSPQSDAAEDKSKEKEPEEPKAPTTFDEFLKIEELDEWPQRITSENLLDLSDEKDILGSKDKIFEELRQATLLDMTVLNDLEANLQKFENSINAVADRMLVTPAGQLDGDTPMPMSVSRAFLTETKECDVVKVHPSRKKNKSDSVSETRKRSVDYCSFPGFRKGELTELPSQLEAPQILNRVTKAQDFNAGFSKFWRKIFQSEASVAMMQDTFWWIFMDNFEKRRRDEQSRLFDRIADSFVALFSSVNPEIKDKIFSVYANCLAQAIYVAFKEAFPESERHFQDDFKEMLVNTTSEWITGISSTSSTWKNWEIKRLQLRTHKPTADSSTQVGSNIMEIKDVKHSLDMADFQRTIQKLGTSDRLAVTASEGPFSRDATKLTVNSPGGTMVPVPINPLPPVTPSRIAECGTPRMMIIESSQIGPGPEIERNMFNLYGRSPLVAHFLNMRQLQTSHKQGCKVRRTLIGKQPEGNKTYRDVIRETKAVQKTLSTEYHRICDLTKMEINKIERQQRETNRRIENLQKDISHCRSGLEVKLMGEKLLDSKEWDAPGLGSRQSTDLKALMKKNPDHDQD